MPKITKPFKSFSVLDVTQGFHDIHRAIDCVKSYGRPLVAPENVRIDEIRLPKSGLTGTDDELANGYGLWMTGLETGYRYQYWHTFALFPCWGGDTVKRGQIVAYMGNSGNVRVNGVYVPLKDRSSEPFKGTHLHETVQVNGKYVDPLSVMDVTTEPTYTTFDEVGAYVRTLKKVAQLLAKGNI